MAGSRPPQRPTEGYWEQIGMVCVDSAAIAIHDSCDTDPDPASRWKRGSGGWATKFGQMGVQFFFGAGDGVYEVWGWIADPGGEDEMLAEVRICMIGDD